MSLPFLAILDGPLALGSLRNRDRGRKQKGRPKAAFCIQDTAVSGGRGFLFAGLLRSGLGGLGSLRVSGGFGRGGLLLS